MSTSTKREITASTASTDEFFEPEDCFVDDDLMVSSPNELNDVNSLTNLPTSKSFLERDNFEAELGSTLEDPFSEDFSSVSAHEIIEVFGGDVVGRPVVIFYAYKLPCNKSFDHDKFLRFIQFTLDKLVDQDYTIIYFHYGLRSNNKPPLKWLLKAYQLLDRRYKKNLKALYLIHPTKFIRIVWSVFKPFISLKFEQKIHYLNSLTELNSIISLSQLNIPQPIIDHDISSNSNRKISSIGSPSFRRPPSPPRPTQQFGVSLEFILNHNPNFDVPPVVIDLIDFLRQNGLHTQGIFRRSAPVNEIEILQSRLNNGEKIDFLADPVFNGDSERAIIYASVLLKKFLRSLEEPVITNKLYSELAQINGISSENRTAAVRELVAKLHPENYALLKTIVEFLIDVADQSQDNLMDGILSIKYNNVNITLANNLSIVFGPNLTWPTDQQVPILQLHNLNSFCYTLIKFYSDVFTRH